MKNNSPIFAKPPSDNISLEDCEFYHVQDIPGLSEPPKGSFDLRKNVNEYLGHVNFKNKTVLELGPASGFLTFHIEKMGGDVTSIDVDPRNNKWDVVPNCGHNKYFAPLSFDEGEKKELDQIKKNQNAYWYAHKAFNSKSKLILSHVNDLPAELGIYDISLMCAVLTHLQNPFLAINNMLRHTKEKVIITELGGYTRIKSFRNIIRNLYKKITSTDTHNASMIFLPNRDKKPFVWWKFSPEIISNMASTLGFEKNTITYHKQTVDAHNTWFFTVVCERTVPIENCNYD